MFKCNEKIKCDVCSCEHNVGGKNCQLDTVKITCGGAGCTCCDEYCNKD